MNQPSPGAGLTVIHTIAGTRADHGGTSRSVPSLCEAISQHVNAVHLVTTRPPSTDIEFNLARPPVVTHLIDESTQFGRLLAGGHFRQTLAGIRAASHVHAGQNSVIIHDHGIWLATNHAVAKFARTTNTPRIVSPRGMLSGWAINRSRMKKQAAWWTYQRRDLQTATAFHVTAADEAKQVRSLGFNQPIAVIPNGVSCPSRQVRRTRLDARRRLLFLSRIHPAKGLFELVHAWKNAAIAPDWELVIAGPNENRYQEQIEAEVRKLDLSDSIHFSGTVNDDDKWQEYANADLFILSSHTENFGLVVAEALTSGLPVITTTGTPWSELSVRGCGWWVRPTADELAGAINAASSLTPEKLNQMGQIGSEWVRKTFTWDAVGTQMSQFYDWLVGRAELPQFVDSGTRRAIAKVDS